MDPCNPGFSKLSESTGEELKDRRAGWLLCKANRLTGLP